MPSQPVEKDLLKRARPSLCANMSETPASSFITVDGEEINHGIERIEGDGKTCHPDGAQRLKDLSQRAAFRIQVLPVA